MEIKSGSIIKTKNGDFVFKKTIITYNPLSLKALTMFIVDDNGKEKIISEKDVKSIE